MAVSVERASKSYQHWWKSTTVLDHVDVHVPRGEVSVINEQNKMRCWDVLILLAMVSWVHLDVARQRFFVASSVD